MIFFLACLLVYGHGVESSCSNKNSKSEVTSLQLFVLFGNK